MKRWMQGLSIILGSIAVTVAALGAAVAWGPHHCKIAFPMVIGCAMANYENLAGGLFAASAALFAGWLAWSAVQVQISAEERRATADRMEVERVLAGDIDSFAEALAAIWRTLESLEEPGDRKTKIAAVVWGIKQITDPAWLSTSRKMVTALGWERRRKFEALFSALEIVGQFRNVDGFDVNRALIPVKSAGGYCEELQPACSPHFDGLERRSYKAWSIGHAIEVQAGVAKYGQADADDGSQA
jgi:hypothetical protein